MHTKTSLTVRLSGALHDLVAANVGDEGSCENVSKYIRREKAHAEDDAFHLLKAELTLAFASNSHPDCPSPQ
jgi:antitoxin ParD1/3/4